MIAEFIQKWNAKHPELPARLSSSDSYAIIDQDRGGYGSIEVRLEKNGTLDVNAWMSDGEEMEPEWMGEAHTVDKAIDCAEYGIHPGNTCAICGAQKPPYGHNGFFILGKKLYCGQHGDNPIPKEFR